MGTNRRYGDRTLDAEIDRAIARKSAVTLPAEAYGPQAITWTTTNRAPVWAWIQPCEGKPQRVAAVVKGYNDRVVIVDVGGTEITVWRTAVSHRRAD